MAIRLTLLCHGATLSMREGRFPNSWEALDDGGLRKLADVRQAIGIHDLVFTSPAKAASQTADTLGFTAPADERLRDIDTGSWAGLSLEQVHGQDEASLAAWLARPEHGVPGGESLQDVEARISCWLAELVKHSCSILAITHPMVVRAALAACLELPQSSVMRFDVAPLSLTILSYNRVWRLQSMGR